MSDTTLEHRVSHLEGREDALAEYLPSLLRRFEGMEARIDEKFERIDGRFERINERFERIDGKFEQMESRMNARFSHIETMVAMARWERYAFLVGLVGIAVAIYLG